LSPEEFAAQQQPDSDFLAGLSFDPTTAKYWDAFNADPAAVNASLPAGSLPQRLYDFRLNPAELASFQKSGFPGQPAFGLLQLRGRVLPGIER
jgi:hypothetical protein